MCFLIESRQALMILMSYIACRIFLFIYITVIKFDNIFGKIDI